MIWNLAWTCDKSEIHRWTQRAYYLISQWKLAFWNENHKTRISIHRQTTISPISLPITEIQGQTKNTAQIHSGFSRNSVIKKWIVFFHRTDSWANFSRIGEIGSLKPSAAQQNVNLWISLSLWHNVQYRLQVWSWTSDSGSFHYLRNNRKHRKSSLWKSWVNSSGA